MRCSPQAYRRPAACRPRRQRRGANPTWIPPAIGLKSGLPAYVSPAWMDKQNRMKRRRRDLPALRRTPTTTALTLRERSADVQFYGHATLAKHMNRSSANSGIGASLLRKEDARFLLGQGKYIADLRMPGVQDVAFVRSQMAHAQVRKVVKPDDAAAAVFTLADLGPLTILEAGPELPQHKLSPYPPLADER